MRRGARVAACCGVVAMLLQPLAGARAEQEALERVVDVRHAVSARVVELGRELDSLFGIDDYRRGSEGSLLRLGGRSLLSDGDDKLEPVLRVRLALPRTEERLNFWFVSEVEDLFEHVADPQRATTRHDGLREESRAGLHYLWALAEDWQLDADAGVRVRLPLDPYVRLRLRRSLLLDAWELRLSPSVFWYNGRGEGAGAEAQLQRQLGEQRLLRLVTDATWLNRERQFYYSQDALLSQGLGRRRAVVAQFGVRGESEPNHRVEEYFVNLRARGRVGWEWLQVELRPELWFGRENAFAPERRLWLTVEVLLGDLRALD